MPAAAARAGYGVSAQTGIGGIEPVILEGKVWKQQFYHTALVQIMQGTNLDYLQPALDDQTLPRDVRKALQCIYDIHRIYVDGAPDAISRGADCRKHYKDLLSAIAIIADDPSTDNPSASPNAALALSAACLISINLFTGVDLTAMNTRLLHTVHIHADALARSAKAGPAHEDAEQKHYAPQMPLTRALQETQESVEPVLAMTARSTVGRIFHSLKAKATKLPKREAGIGFDPYNQGNVPSSTPYVAADGKSYQRIRMGTPTTQGLNPNDVQLLPTFRAYLMTLTERGDRSGCHLYFNRQTNEETVGGALKKALVAEPTRSAFLAQQSEDPTLAKKLKVIAMPADGALYKLSEKYQAAHGIRQFDNTGYAAYCGAVATAMAEGTDGFQFPDEIIRKYAAPGASLAEAKAQFKAAMQQKMAGLIDAFPDAAAHHSPEVWHTMLFIFLNKVVVDEMLHQTGATSFNNSCKDGIDRGGIANAIAWVLEHPLPRADAPAHELQHYLNQFEGVLFGPAAQVQKRGIAAHRFDEICMVLDTMTRFPPDLRAIDALCAGTP